MSINLSRFTITENAYYYVVNKPISKRLIEELFKSASAQKKGAFSYKEIKVPHVFGGLHFVVSGAVFKYESLPSFLKPGAEIETKYGYILLVEYGNFLVISKRATSDFNSLLDGYVDEIDYGTLSKYKISPSTQFKKLGVSNLDTSKKAMRRTVYEAEDVQGSLSTISAGSKVVSSLKIENLNGQTSIAIGTSRINDLGNKVDIKGFCVWASSQCDKIKTFKPITCYLDNFAEPMNYIKEISALMPISILFNLSPFLDDFENGLIDKVWFFKDTEKREIGLKTFIESNDLCMDVHYNSAEKKFEIVNSFDSTLNLVKGKRGIYIDGWKIKNIYVQYNSGELVNLLNRINRECLFTVSFQNVEIKYTSKTLFRDSKLLGNIEYFLKSISAAASLSKTTSEKGRINNASSKFDSNSIFNIIETSISKDQFLLCDDLGDEWADYIGFTERKSICFYHAKASKKKYSASAFHDIVSQALKNIGNFDFNKDLSAKRAKISSFYSGSKIKRLRKGKALSCFKCLKATYNSPNISKEIALVINFLNKKQFETELKNLKIGRAKNQTVQILWLLSTLIGTCQERGINVRIITC